MSISPLTPGNLPEAARFLSRLNSIAEHNICYIGQTDTEIAAELSVVMPPEGYGLLALDETGQVTGFLGVELDQTLGRGWLIGPFVDSLDGQAGQDWHTLAEQLYRDALEAMPAEINDLELCGRPENTRLEAFAARHGFIPGAEAALLSLPRPAEAVDRIPDQVKTTTLDSHDQMASFLPALSALHDSLFPNTYYSAAQLLAMSAEEDKRLQIELVAGELAGYIFLQARPANRDANIDFLGVAEPYRRRGIAGKLLSNALAWAFSHAFVEKAILTVHTSDTAAVRLYERACFHTEYIMRGYRKKDIG
jgi:GNAT superfamily N-acetyltransferase